MTAQSPQAYAFSTLIHAAVVGLILFFAFLTQTSTHEVPKIMELVAGAGDNYGATAAPALGSLDGSKLKLAIPSDALPAPQVPPAPAEATPIAPAPESAQSTHAPRSPNFLADLKRIEKKRTARLEAAYLKKQQAEERKRLSYEQFQKQQVAKGVTKIDAEGIREGVVGGSAENKTGGAGGKALTREEGELLEAYFALLKSKIKDNHVAPDGVSDALSAKVEFFVAADGSLSKVHVVKSSGSSEFDQSVLEAVAHTASIGPRPDGKSETVTMTFRMREEEPQ